MTQPTIAPLEQPALQLPEPASTASQAALPPDVAEYIADMLDDLREMASRSGHEVLHDLLDIAHRVATTPSIPPTLARRRAPEP